MIGSPAWQCLCWCCSPTSFETWFQAGYILLKQLFQMIIGAYLRHCRCFPLTGITFIVGKKTNNGNKDNKIIYHWVSEKEVILHCNPAAVGVLTNKLSPTTLKSTNEL